MVTTAVKIKEEFDQNMHDLLEEGAVDLTLPVPHMVNFGGPDDTTTLGVMLTLNNALRLRREGLFEPCDKNS